ncbi:MAG: hypothetical protein IPG50_38625 [Myxococcales bacterium]|nr:hypothetical protein [Myxococcales bacterium]
MRASLPTTRHFLASTRRLARRGLRSLAPLLVSGLALGVSPLSLLACQGCRGTGGQGQPAQGTASVAAPTFRLYAVSDVAGAIEPCGCVKDQLGGLDHLAAYVLAEKKNVPASAVLSAGPLFFLDPTLSGEKRAQDIKKAETLASALAHVGLVAFAPGRNDWAAGGEELARLSSVTGAAVVAGNLDGVPAPWRGPSLRDLGGIKVGFAGAVSFARAELGAPEGVTAAEAIPVIRAQVAELKKKGAQVVVALLATGRGEAKRVAEAVPELLAVVCGSASSRGEGNSETPSAERVGDVIVAESGNHLTTAVVLDFFVRDGSLKFADGSGLEEAQKRSSLQRRIEELRGRVAQLESSAELRQKVQKGDIEARRAELTKLEAERASLDKRPAPATGSFFRYQVVEVREKLGSDPGVIDRLGAYYKHVNEANRVAFAGKVPRPVAKGQPSYAGVDACDACHSDAREVWDKTPHARAYATLTKQHKEFNLDCVSCHVTGYDQPGGSTVTAVKGKENVQCETCHGPSSLHADNPKVAVPIPKPKGDQCLACHHPPHVHEFDPAARMPEILGKGHGR